MLIIARIVVYLLFSKCKTISQGFPQPTGSEDSEQKGARFSLSLSV